MTTAERAALEAMLDANDRRISEAFLDAIRDITDQAKIGRIESALRMGRYDLALDALGLDDAAFDRVSEAVRIAYIDSGRSQAAIIAASRAAQGYAAVFRFNARNMAAERWLQEQSSLKITNIAETTRDAVRGALRAGMERGDNPRTVALDIAGRMPKGAKRRTGGIVGLNDVQAKWAQSARAELESGDPAQLRNYLRREKRDKRFDANIRRALKTGKPIPRAKIQEMAARYNDRLLKLRADTIARTEALQSLSASRHQAYSQAVADGVLPADAITKRWKDARDGRVRDSHAGLNNKEVLFNEAFISPLGSRLEYPGDTSHGARAADIIQCRCIVEYRVDFVRVNRDNL
jgi:hypothetical protein